MTDGDENIHGSDGDERRLGPIEERESYSLTDGAGVGISQSCIALGVDGLNSTANGAGLDSDACSWSEQGPYGFI